MSPIFQLMTRVLLAMILATTALSASHGQSTDDEPAEPFSRFSEDDAEEPVLQEFPAPRQARESGNPQEPEQEPIEPGIEAQSAEPASPSDKPIEAAPLTPMTPVSPPKIWSGNVELGINGTEGNTETFNIRVGGKATAKYAWSTQTYEAIFVENTNAAITTARNAIGDGRWEIPLWSPVWNYYAHGRLEYDEFKPFDLRVAGDTGLGYDWIKTDINMFQTRTGISTSREFGGAEDFWKPELAFGLEWRRTIDARQKITIKSDYFPTWDDFSDYRLNTQADWEFAIQPAWNLSLKLSAISRYDSTPNGVKPQDLNYAALVLWNY